jgi:hypothetical protein
MFDGNLYLCMLFVRPTETIDHSLRPILFGASLLLGVFISFVHVEFSMWRRSSMFLGASAVVRHVPAVTQLTARPSLEAVVAVPTAKPGDSSVRKHIPCTRTTAVVGWVNTMFLVGVVKDVKVGMQQGLPVAELKVLATEYLASVDHTAQLPKVLVEKTMISVLCFGDHWKEYVKSNVKVDTIVHVVGHLNLRPMYLAQSALYEYRHEVRVRDQCGQLTAVRTESIQSG